MSDTPHFMRLSQGQRREFVERNRGFLQDVKKALFKKGLDYRTATLSRTFYGLFLKPDPMVVEELHRHYLLRRDARREAQATLKKPRKPREQRKVRVAYTFELKDGDLGGLNAYHHTYISGDDIRQLLREVGEVGVQEQIAWGKEMLAGAVGCSVEELE